MLPAVVVCIINNGKVAEGCTFSSCTPAWLPWYQPAEGPSCHVLRVILWRSPSMRGVQHWSTHTSCPSARLPPLPAHTLLLPLKREPLSQVDVRHEALEWANDHFRLIGDGPLGIVVLRAMLSAKHSALSQQYVVYKHAHVQETALLMEVVLFRTCIYCFILIPSCFLWVPFFPGQQLTTHLKNIAYCNDCMAMSKGCRTSGVKIEFYSHPPWKGK